MNNNPGIASGVSQETIKVRIAELINKEISQSVCLVATTMVPERSGPMTLEEWRAEVNKPQEGGPDEVFRKLEIERANLFLRFLEEQESFSRSTFPGAKAVRYFSEWMIRQIDSVRKWCR